MATRILIVEDEATLRETLAYNLTHEGCQVVKSGDGAEALEMARADKFDLIVLDILLPNLDGLSFCRMLRKEQTTPIIMLTVRGGEVIEFDVTGKIFTRPSDKRTEDYVTGRFG